MEILFIAPRIKKNGGQAVQIIQLAKFLNLNGHDIIIISPENVAFFTKEIRAFENSRFKFGIFKKIIEWIPVRYLILIVKGIKYLKLYKVKVIQAFDPHLSGIVGTILGKLFNIPVVIRIGAKYNEFYIYKYLNNKPILRSSFIKSLFSTILSQIEKYSLNKCDKIIAICDFIFKYISSKSYLKDHKKIKVIPSGINLSSLIYNDILRNSAKLGRYIIYVGRVVRYKGIDLLIESVAEILKKYDLKLLIVGSTEFDPKFVYELKNKVNKYRLNKKIIFTGIIPHKMIPSMLKNAEMLVLPSLKKKYDIEEGIPNVILEAFNLECPVIASNVGGIPEIVHNYKTGLLFESGNKIELSEMIKILIHNSELREKIIKNAKNYLVKNRNIHTLYASYIKIYEELQKI
ncbi:MAG: glycosyltransferase family 4 protein [Candidatus Helarchaeota archaeon]